jgi:pentatricopeptide repeat protein
MTNEQAIQYGQTIYTRMLQDANDDPYNYEYHPTALTILNLLYICGKNRQPPEEWPEALLAQLQEWYQETKRPDLAPTVRHYAALVTAYSNTYSSASSSSSSSKASAAISRMIDLTSHAYQEIRNQNIPMDWIALNQMLHSLSSLKEETAANTVYDILQDLITFSQQGHTEFLPNQSTFLAALSAMGRTKQAHMAEDIMNQMEDLYRATQVPSVRPNKPCYGALIWAYVNIGNVEQAEATVVRMSDEYDLADPDLWNGVLASWAQAGEDDAIQKTASVIEWLEKEMLAKKKVETIPTATTTTTTTTATPATTSSSDLSGDGTNDRTSDTIPPTPAVATTTSTFPFPGKEQSISQLSVGTFNSLMGSYANHQDKQLGVRLALDLFTWMQHHENPNVHPNGNTYLCLIKALHRAHKTQEVDEVLRMACEHNLSGPEKPILLEDRHFNMCISAWGDSKSKNAIVKATELFQYMSAVGVAPTIITYNSLLKVYMRHGPGLSPNHKDKDKNNNNNNNQWVRDCLQLLREATERADAGELRPGPDRITYNTVLTALIHSQHYQKRHLCMSVFLEMCQRGILPDHITYDSLMNMYLHRNDPQAVEAIFRKMQESYKRNGHQLLKVKSESYSLLLRAWSKAGNPEKTVDAISEMTEQYERGELTRSPTLTDFHAVIRSWLRSGRDDAGAQAIHVLQSLHLLSDKNRYDCTPNARTYNHVLSILRQYPNRPDAGGLKAFALLQEMKERNVVPNIYSYGITLATLAAMEPMTPEILSLMHTIVDELSAHSVAFWSTYAMGKTMQNICQNVMAKPNFEGKDEFLDKWIKLLVKKGYWNGIRPLVEKWQEEKSEQKMTPATPTTPTTGMSSGDDEASFHSTL